MRDCKRKNAINYRRLAFFILAGGPAAKIFVEIPLILVDYQWFAAFGTPCRREQQVCGRSVPEDWPGMMTIYPQLALSATRAAAEAMPKIDKPDNMYHMLIWGMVLILFLVVGGAGLLWFRHRIAATKASMAGAFSLDALQDMRASGELTEEEFRTLRDDALPIDVQAFVQEQDDKDPNSTLSHPSSGDDEDR